MSAAALAASEPRPRSRSERVRVEYITYRERKEVNLPHAAEVEQSAAKAVMQHFQPQNITRGSAGLVLKKFKTSDQHVFGPPVAI